MSRPVRILLVEDNPADVLLLREALLQHSVIFTLQHYSDGEEAAKAIAGIPVCPDLILLDINVPRIDGFDLLTVIRAGEVTGNAAVAMFTSSRADADRRKAEQLGADAYIVKPSGYEEFVDQVGKAILGLLERDRDPGAVTAKHYRMSSTNKIRRRASLITEFGRG